MELVENSIIPDLDLREMISYSLNIIMFTGFLRPEKRSKYDIGYKASIVFFVGLFFILYMSTEFANIVVVFGDVEEMTQASFLFLTHFVQFFKFFSITQYNDLLWDMILRLNMKAFEPRTLSQRQMLTERISLSKKIAKCFVYLGIATCGLWAVFPFVDSGKTEVELPLSGWFPFRTDYSPVFELIYLYQVCGSTFNAVINISMDTLIAMLIFFVSCQLEILNDSLAKAKEICERRVKENNGRRNFNEEIEVYLRELVNHHRYILK